MTASIISSVVAALATIVSATLVYMATRQSTTHKANADTRSGYLQEIERLRSDLTEVDAQRKSYYDSNVHLLRSIERYRAWGYSLVRLLHNHDIHDVPPEPEELPA